MKWMINIVLVLLVAFGLSSGIVSADAGEKIKWSATYTGVLDKLHPYTLNWSGDVLDKGGLNLSTMKVTSSSTDADIVINQYGAMGAAGILKLQDKSLEDPTDSNISGFVNSVTIEKGATYLVVLHDGSFAKIRIDRFLPEQGLSITKVFFTYVIEEERYKTSQQESNIPSVNPNPSTPLPSIPEKPDSSSTDAGQNPQVPITKPWSENYEVPGGSQYKTPFSIYLTLDSNSATVYNKENKITEYRLYSAPFLYESRTMVPLRFISEALGAKVEWNGEDKSISIINESVVIVLWIDRKYANVSGKVYELDAPPMIKGESTMIPLRFVSEHLKMKVYFNNGAILITDTDNPYFETSQPTPTETKETQEQAVDTGFFHGKWDLWVPGGFVPNNTQTYTNTYVPGAQADWIEINGDGTYKWLDLGKTYEGTWVPGDTSDKITLKNGPMDSDWTMRKESENEIKIYAWGLEYKGTKFKE